ncbi:MAG TPA: GyrI-like domain-containing protein [Thermotogota bacterium]|nr:GyrI-like domain-containing protein [Thermotogota bacterium]
MNSPDRELRNEYLSRINLVLDYIEQNLSKELTLEELSEVAHFSKFHFHRIFNAFMGETLFQYIQRIRLQKSAALLLNRKNEPITEIAFDCGFSSSAAFSRSFKTFFQMTPTQWKKKMIDQHNMNQKERNINQDDSKGWKENIPRTLYNLDILSDHGRNTMSEKKGCVVVKDLEQFTVAYVRYIGPYAGNNQLFESLFGKLFSWAGARGLTEQQDAKVLVIYHDDPHITDEDKLRTSVCLSVPEDTEVGGEIGKMPIDGGKYAFVRFELDTDEYTDAWNWVYSQWLPTSGYLPDDRTCFELYPEPDPEQTDGKTVVDICIPIKPM